MSSDPKAAEIWQDATWLAQAIDPGAGVARFVQLTADDYRRESFLDDRILSQGRSAHLLRWADIEAALPPDVRSDARWIFHVGHVGSTLISRLLGELDGVLSVREPRCLRDLTFFPAAVREAYVPGLRALMSRTFKTGQSAVVKATSMVSEIAAELAGERGRSLFLYASPDAYLRTILAGDRSADELQTLADYYARRAEKAGIPMLAPARSHAEAAALVWACEMNALERAAQQLPTGSTMWLDFDSFLMAPEESLTQVASFLGLPGEDQQIASIVQGPVMRRYSKAPEYEFGPDTRRRVLADAAQRHSAAIGAALALLGHAAEKAPNLARALSRSKLDC